MAELPPKEFSLALSYYSLMKDDYYKIFNNEYDILSSSSSSNSSNSSSSNNNNVSNDIKKNVDTNNDVGNNVEYNIDFQETKKAGILCCSNANNKKEKAGGETMIESVLKTVENCIIT